MARILLCVPQALGYARAEFQMAMLSTVIHLREHGHEVVMELDESGSIVRSRNLAVAKVLLEPWFTHLMFMDSDMSWRETDAMHRMIELDRGVICGVYTTKWKEPRWTMMVHGELQDIQVDQDGLIMLRKAPTGFMVIQREVLETIAEERPDLKINFNSVINRPDYPDGFIEPGQYLIFDARRSNEEAYYVSDDYGFSETWTGLGGYIWGYPYVTISHHFMTAHTANLGDFLAGLGVQGLKPPGGTGGLALVKD